MKKNLLQDVIPPKKSIRNIEVPAKNRRWQDNPNKDRRITSSTKQDFESREPENKVKRNDHQKEYNSEQIQSVPITVENKRSSTSFSKIEESTEADRAYSYEYVEPPKQSKKGLYFAVGLFLFAAAFGVSALFKSAKITVTPQQEVKVLNHVFTAKKDATTGLGFQVVSTTKDVEKQVKATSEEKVEKKARGKIVIYNNYSSAPQKLVATTRFETLEGLIFRALNDVIVPGRQTKDGKTVSGSVEILVEADKPGANYNISLKDFTIPGFKGDPKFTTIYARSKTEMSGGFSGMQKKVSQEFMNEVNIELEDTLKEALKKDIISGIPADFVLYTSSLSYEFDGVTQVNIEKDPNTLQDFVVLQKKGRVDAIIFDKGSLSRMIFGVLLPDTEELIKITNLEKLEFEYVSSPPFGQNSNNTLTFTLKGDADLVWIFDENKLKTDLLGLSKNEAQTVIGTYGNIKEAWIETHPFWNQSIPTAPKNVILINTLSKQL